MVLPALVILTVGWILFVVDFAMFHTTYIKQHNYYSYDYDGYNDESRYTYMYTNLEVYIDKKNSGGPSQPFAGP